MCFENFHFSQNIDRLFIFLALYVNLFLLAAGSITVYCAVISSLSVDCNLASLLGRDWKFSIPLYSIIHHVWKTTGAAQLLPLTLPNANRFSKFFH